MSAAHIICANVPLKLISEANAHTHWRERQRRAKLHRKAAREALGPDIKGPPPPYVITITRIGPRTLDSDNLAGAAKHVRDGVADWLGIDDGDKRLTWLYDQRSGGPGVYGCEISIRAEMQGPA
jgi:hypothetical protein